MLRVTIFPTAALIAFAALSIGAGAVARAQELVPPPAPRPDPRASAHTAWRWGLVLGGAALFAAPYAGSCAVAHNVLCVPFAGPFVLLARQIQADRRPTTAEDPFLPPVFLYTLLVGMGAMEVAGAALTVAALVWGNSPPARNRPTIALVPLVGPQLTGLTLGASF